MGWGGGSEGHRDNGNDYLWAGGVGLRDTETMVMITYGLGIQPTSASGFQILTKNFLSIKVNVQGP